ncbi:MAG: amidohydrolase family protein [Planctomycetaceae bacterium]|jgi:N-acetylglucosamine-6-phosphate deacetylase|nr:amidohydrolase family protein [Planctomycetaceae bacterium]
MSKLFPQQPEDPQRLALVGGAAILPDRVVQDAYVEWAAGRLTRIGAIPKRISKDVQVIDATGSYISPGWVDIHVHGGGGADFMDGDVKAIETACKTHLRHGTTTLFPTTTTGSHESIIRMIKSVDATIRSGDATIRSGDATIRSGDASLPTIQGVHLYGPYFTPEKSGCHRKEGCRAPVRSEFEAYFKAGPIGIATCAAELDGCSDFYRYAKKRGCLVTCGHSNSSWNEMANAHRCGMSHVDHFWCAMSSVASVRTRLGTPMQGSMLEFVLAHETMSTEVIADGYHLSPELLQFAWQMKKPSMLCLVSDTSRALDMPAGKYAFGHPQEDVWIESNGKVGLSPTGGLASSIVALDHCVRHMASVTKIPLFDIVRMASLTPAQRTGIDGQCGSLEVGKRADVLVLDKKLRVQKVYYCPGQRAS